MNNIKILPDEAITIEEMCSLLMISPATARNWVKNGKLKPVKTNLRKLCFAKKDVEKLLNSIKSGESDKLTRRRNKTKHIGNVVPAGYVLKKEYTDAAKRIVACFDKLGGGERLMSMILAEYSMKLLAGRGLIEPVSRIHMSEYILRGSYLGQYRSLISDILFGSDFTREEIAAAQEALCEEIEYIETEDFLGLLYMSISSIAKRKTEGVYYTPKKIAEDCAEYLRDIDAIKGKKILDPCCGTGNFLMNIYQILSVLTNETDGEKIIGEQLFAADIDPISICLARVNLTLAAKLMNTQVLYQNLRVTDSLFDFKENTFDVILSNPPWGSAYDIAYEVKIREQFSLSSLSYIESFAVFLFKAIQTCKDGGTICYVLPQSFLNVMAHEKLREYVLDSCDILKVKYWRNIFDKVYAPSISITLRKGKAQAGFIEVENGGEPYRISTTRLLKSAIFNFSVRDNKNDLILKLDQKHNVVRLADNADFALGIVTGDNQSFLKDRRFKEMEPVLRGIDIYAYTYEKPQKYLKFDPKRFQQVAPEHFYRAPEKLIYRFVSSSLCFAYDNKQTLSLNSCNVLIPHFSDIPIKYVLAVLNSSVAHFYFTNKYQSVKVLRSHIEGIPIPVSDGQTYTKACCLVDEIIAAGNTAQRFVLIEQLDTLVKDVFELTESERALIAKDAPAYER